MLKRHKLKLSGLSAIAVALLTALTLSGGAGAARTAVATSSPATQPTRHLILLPGGGFLRHDRSFEPQMVAAATRAGFQPHYLSYRLGDIDGALADARGLADYLGSRYGTANVFAYGSSAGATLGLLLASEGRVAATVASSALYDFSRWNWGELNWGPQYYSDIGASAELRRRLSPLRRPLRCPVLALHGSWDPVVPVFQAIEYSVLRRRTVLKVLPGGHGLYKRRPGTVSLGLDWLRRSAALQKTARRMGRQRLNAIRPAARRRAVTQEQRFRELYAERLCAPSLGST